jgi:hypothetical protein
VSCSTFVNKIFLPFLLPSFRNGTSAVPGSISVALFLLPFPMITATITNFFPPFPLSLHIIEHFRNTTFFRTARFPSSLTLPACVFALPEATKFFG